VTILFEPNTPLVLAEIACSAGNVLHLLADLAVILAVIIGLLEFYGHGRERTERTAAVDAHVRVLAIQARVQVGVERRGRSLGDLLSRLVTRGSLPGELMATWLTTMAAEAPRATSPLRRAASDAAEVFFALADRVEQQRTRLQGRIPEDDQDLIQRFNRFMDSLKTIAPEA
jgi:hypothetical protein